MRQECAGELLWRVCEGEVGTQNGEKGKSMVYIFGSLIALVFAGAILTIMGRGIALDILLSPVRRYDFDEEDDDEAK